MVLTHEPRPHPDHPLLTTTEKTLHYEQPHKHESTAGLFLVNFVVPDIFFSTEFFPGDRTGPGGGGVKKSVSDVCSTKMSEQAQKANQPCMLRRKSQNLSVSKSATRAHAGPLPLTAPPAASRRPPRAPAPIRPLRDGAQSETAEGPAQRVGHPASLEEQAVLDTQRRCALRRAQQHMATQSRQESRGRGRLRWCRRLPPVRLRAPRVQCRKAHASASATDASRTPATTGTGHRALRATNAPSSAR